MACESLQQELDNLIELRDDISQELRRPDRPPAERAELIRNMKDVSAQIARVRDRLRRCRASPPQPRATVPFVLNLPPNLAEQEVRQAGLSPRFTGLGGNPSFVASQQPIAGRVVARNSVVTMFLRSGPVP